MINALQRDERAEAKDSVAPDQPTLPDNIRQVRDRVGTTLATGTGLAVQSHRFPHRIRQGV